MSFSSNYFGRMTSLTRYGFKLNEVANAYEAHVEKLRIESLLVDEGLVCRSALAVENGGFTHVVCIPFAQGERLVRAHAHDLTSVRPMWTDDVDRSWTVIGVQMPYAVRL